MVLIVRDMEMTSSELELARKYLGFTQKVLDTKKAELVEALALVQKLRNEVTDAERECESAKSSLHRVERQLDVVEIDESDYVESCGRNIGLPLVPTHPMRISPAKSVCWESPKIPAMMSQLLIEGKMGLFKNKVLPSSLRCCLKRHQRKLLRLCEEHERKAKEVEPAGEIE